jgi:YHS domain-containing protein
MKIPFFSKSESAIDPVCQMEVDVSNPPGGSSEHEGTMYYFCGTGCRVAFQRNPSGFLDDPADGFGSMSDASSDESVAATEQTSGWGFRLLETRSQPDIRVVDYSCRCGCTPKARFRAESGESGSEHCCCGRVHFAGPDAVESLRDYMNERASKGMDADVGPYEYGSSELTPSTGAAVPVAFAEPSKPRK